MNVKSVFGFSREPFPKDLPPDKLYPTPGLQAATERLQYAASLAAVAIITGEVGAGKSTTLRYAASKLHPSLYRVIPVVASSGSILEIYRQIALALDVGARGISLTLLSKTIRDVLIEIAQKNISPVLVIDEANLMRLEVFAQLQTLSQFDFDSRPVLAMILAGQNNLIDKLVYHGSRPLASRVVGRTHLEGLKLKDMTGYLKHHLEVAGVPHQLFSDEAITAIHQGSGGLPRTANALARGSLIAAASEKASLVAAEHVRKASSELFMPSGHTADIRPGG
jgi:general secretion pathway protein A